MEKITNVSETTKKLFEKHVSEKKSIVLDGKKIITEQKEKVVIDMKTTSE